MFRVFNEDLDNNKALQFALAAKIYGLGQRRALDVCVKAGLDPRIRVKTLKETDANAIMKAVNDLGYLVETDLRRAVKYADRRLASIRCERWIRREKGLPCRGQRTHSNGNTASRSNRKV